MNLTAQQRQAVALTLHARPPLAGLTGGPGTGKTTTLRALLTEAKAMGLRTACAAPSGKAAQRMEEATGFEASTLHRLLGLQPESDAWEPLVYTDLLVVDEASMVDVRLMAMTLQAAQAGGVKTILLVGDADQLPPVGPGQPFHDLLAGGACPVVRLTEVHRQAAESGIVRAAHAIVAGEMPEWSEDFQLAPCEELEDVPKVAWTFIAHHGLDPATSQVLAPQRTTVGGVEAVNDYIERARRPVEGELVRDKFREGTKVINTRNDYNLGVFNGELGTVLTATAGDKPARDVVEVEIAGETKTYRGGALKQLQPAWCLTVHKSQGSQWEEVIVVAHKAHSFMLTRRLLYVAVTRAAKRVTVVGQEEAVARAVKNTRDAKRRTWLAGRFKRDRERREAEEAGV